LTAEKLRPGADTQAESQRQRDQQLDALESGFKQEPTDAAWAAQTTARVEETLAAFAVAPSGVRDIECRASTCRLEIAGDTLLDVAGKEPASLDKGLPLLVNRLADSLPSMTAFQVEDGYGATSTVLFFSRETDLPPSGK